MAAMEGPLSSHELDPVRRGHKGCLTCGEHVGIVRLAGNMCGTPEPLWREGRAAGKEHTAIRPPQGIQESAFTAHEGGEQAIRCVQML